MYEIKERLEAMLQWSDRMGSDEIDEINELINICNDIMNRLENIK